MKSSVILLSILSAFSLLIAIFAAIQGREEDKQIRFSPVVELWLSFAFMHLLIFLAIDLSHELAPLLLLGWIWPMRGMWRYLDSFHIGLHKKPVLFLIFGSILSVAYLHMDQPFVTYALPFFIGFALCGLVFVWNTIKTMTKVSEDVRGTMLMFTLFSALQILVPFWEVSEKIQTLSLVSNAVILVIMSVTTLFATLNPHRKEKPFIHEEDLLGKAKFFELGMMSAGIAHEINNPLTIIQARTTQLLRIYRNPEQQKELARGLQQILYTTERIDRTIKGVRNVFYQQDQIPYERLELKSILDNVLVFVGQRLKNHGIELRMMDIEDVYLRGHEVQLEQVFVNLINNSLDAVDKLSDKWIEVSTIKRAGYVDIYFKDSGEGISPDVVEHMMEPFYSTKGNKGTGLGLTLINAILHKHGGNITYVLNAPHTTFLIELPLDERDQRGVDYEVFSIQ
ncbi:sensor histidine kinase [Peredibacter sp. HCB2-198]|uniref:sensor histidine kinase n=1 Tax=Peredibacter sp. HCB2-198 TaxID=3383025 RepID=UPI0038B4CFC3